MTKKFTYVVCVYFGMRANQKYNSIITETPYFFIDKHIEFLQNYKNSNLEKVIFIVNLNPNDNVDDITQYFSEKSQLIPDNIQFILSFRTNLFFSYGAWNDAIIEDLSEESDESSYYFCLEDDYIPYTLDFISPFISKCTESAPYVCTKAVVNHESYLDHPSMSVGLFLKSSCQKVLDKNRYVFLVNGDNSYPNAWRIQQTFYRPFLEMGYGIADVADNYTCPFLDSATNEVKNFGKENSPILVGPIIV